MKFPTLRIAVSLASIFALSSCTQHYYSPKDGPKAATPVKTQDPKQAQVNTIMKLRDQRILSDVEAQAKIAKIYGLESASPQPTPTSQVAPTAITPAPTAPAPVMVVDANMDLNLPVYKAQAQLNGQLNSIGSDSMDRMMEMWSEKFIGHHPSLQFSHEGKGSSTAIPALIEGRSNVGPMSRAFKSSEIAKFENEFGYKPQQVRVAVDSLGIFIHPSNPLVKSGLSLAQADAIFSSSRLRKGKEVKTWGDLGLTGEWAKAPIKVYSRNTASGTYGFFKKKLLLKGDFKETNMELESSEAVVESVAKNKFAVGFSGIAYKTDNVACLALADSKGADFVAPNEMNALSGSYPLTRSLFISYNVKPNGLDNTQKEFIKFVFSRTGQSVVRKDGYFPVNAMVAKVELSKLKL